MRTKIDRHGSNRWRVVVRRRDGTVIHTSPWAPKKSAEHAAVNHRALNRDIGLGYTVEVEEYTVERDARTRSHSKTRSSDGRTMAEAAAAGDSFQVETLDGKHHLYMPGSRGVAQTLRHVRKHWPNRIGQRVRVYRVLPGSRTGAMMLKEHGEATL